MLPTYDKNRMLFVTLFKKDDLLRPVHTTRDCPEFKERGWFDDYPRAIVYDNVVFGDTKKFDIYGFRIYIEDAFIWNAGSPLDW